jgi:hypothetical protein
MLKHVGVFMYIMYIVSQSAVVGKYIDCRNMDGIGNIKKGGITVQHFFCRPSKMPSSPPHT